MENCKVTKYTITNIQAQKLYIGNLCIDPQLFHLIEMNEEVSLHGHLIMKLNSTLDETDES